MAQIDVRRTGKDGEGRTTYRVRVSEGGSETTHEVAVSSEDFARLGVRCRSHEELLERSFAFLLEREPKGSILPRFHITEIERYFPEYEREITGG